MGCHIGIVRHLENVQLQLSILRAISNVQKYHIRQPEISTWPPKPEIITSLEL